MENHLFYQVPKGIKDLVTSTQTMSIFFSVGPKHMLYFLMYVEGKLLAISGEWEFTVPWAFHLSSWAFLRSFSPSLHTDVVGSSGN